MRTRLVKIRGLAWKLAVPAAGLAVACQLALAGTASATHTGAVTHHSAGTILPARVNALDCNGYSKKYALAATHLRSLCTDPLRYYDGHATRFYDNGHYVGHDEPSVKFISSAPGSGNNMRYALRLPRDPSKAPTASGSVTDYAELSLAPWFGLPMCDPRSYPLNPCKPDSDSNSGRFSNPKSAGSAFMEMQFYPPGFTPFVDGVSCSRTQWCAALTIDSLECSFNFGSCNNNCIEPVNFSYLQTNGVPPGSPAPQDPGLGTFFGNSKTLKMNPGDVLKVSITDPPSGFLVKISDLTTHQTGFMQASAANGFVNTSKADCSGHPFTWHAEYSSARQQNQVPWAALEGGVLMQQEVGHFESCGSIANTVGFTFNSGAYADPGVAQTCNNGRDKAGEGPCNFSTGACQHSATQGRRGPVACPQPNFITGTVHCEFSDTPCMKKGSRSVTFSGKPAMEFFRVAGCVTTGTQNGDLDYDGNTYLRDWPNGGPNFPQTFRYIGPFTASGKLYPQVQFETDAGGSERLCNVLNGAGCALPPAGARFYPFWSMTRAQRISGVARRGVCIWNFGNDIKGATKTDFGRDRQYGKPDTARYGGTFASKVLANPALGAGCKHAGR